MWKAVACPMLAFAGLLGVGSALTSCHDDDAVTVGEGDVVEDTVRPTDDQLGVKYAETVKVFGDSRTGFNASVVNRMTNVDGQVSASEKAFVFTKGCNASLTDAEAVSMVKAYANRANYVFVNPESFPAETLAASLEKAAQQLEDQGFDTEGVELLISHIRTLNTYTSAEAVAFRREAIYVIPKLEVQAEMSGKNTTAYAVDENGNAVKQNCASVSYQPTAYDYGLAADMLVTWMKNDTDSDSDDGGSNSASGTINDYITADPVTYNFVVGPSRALEKSMHYSMSFQVYPVHDFDHNRDYYFIRQNNNFHASELDCVRNTDRGWKKVYKEVIFDDGATSGHWYSSRSNLWYGPYMSKLYLAASVEQTDQNEKISVEKALPQTDLSGTTTVQTGISYTLSGSLGLKTQGPKQEGDPKTAGGTGGLKGGIMFSESHSHKQSDLKVYHSDYGGNFTQWTFSGVTPVFEKSVWSAVGKHTQVADFQITDWQNELTWIFIVDNPKADHEYQLKVEHIAEIKELNYNGFNFELAVHPTQTFTVLLPAPNRFQDLFTMSCSNNALQTLISERLSCWQNELTYYGHSMEEILQGATDYFTGSVKKAIMGLDLAEFKTDGTYSFHLRKLGSSADIVTYNLTVKDGKATAAE